MGIDELFIRWPLLFLPFIAGGWGIICLVLAAISGWRRLGEAYFFSGPIPEDRSWFVSGKIGWANYRNCLIVTTTSAGLYLAVVPFFRPGHPPLLIPWTDTQARTEGGWFKQIRLTMASAPGVRIRLPSHFAESLKKGGVEVR